MSTKVFDAPTHKVAQEIRKSLVDHDVLALVTDTRVYVANENVDRVAKLIEEGELEIPDPEVTDES